MSAPVTTSSSSSVSESLSTCFQSIKDLAGATFSAIASAASWAGRHIVTAGSAAGSFCAQMIAKVSDVATPFFKAMGEVAKQHPAMSAATVVVGVVATAAVTYAFFCQASGAAPAGGAPVGGAPASGAAPAGGAPASGAAPAGGAPASATPASATPASTATPPASAPAPVSAPVSAPASAAPASAVVEQPHWVKTSTGSYYDFTGHTMATDGTRQVLIPSGEVLTVTVSGVKKPYVLPPGKRLPTASDVPPPPPVAAAAPAAATA